MGISVGPLPAAAWDIATGAASADRVRVIVMLPVMFGREGKERDRERERGEGRRERGRDGGRGRERRGKGRERDGEGEGGGKR